MPTEEVLLKRKINIRLIWPILSGFLELVGIASIICGCFLLSPFLGLISGGIGLILIGLAIDPPTRPNNPGVKR